MPIHDKIDKATVASWIARLETALGLSASNAELLQEAMCYSLQLAHDVPLAGEILLKRLEGTKVGWIEYDLSYLDVTETPVFRSKAEAKTPDDEPALSLTISKPGGTVEGDLLLACIVAYGDCQPNITPPSGWSNVRLRGINEISMCTYAKWAGAAEPSDYTWDDIFVTGVSEGVGEHAIGVIARVDKVDTTNPVNATSYNEITTPAVLFPSTGITTTNNNCLIIQAMAAPIATYNFHRMEEEIYGYNFRMTGKSSELDYVNSVGGVVVDKVKVIVGDIDPILFYISEPRTAIVQTIALTPAPKE